MHSLMHAGCSGTQHEDSVRLLQRLQAAADQPIPHSSTAHSAAAANSIADASCALPPDLVDVSSWSMPGCKTMLTVQNSEMRGRELAVTQDTAAGTVLWREQPFVHSLLKQHRKQVCLVLLADRKSRQCSVVLHALMSLSRPCFSTVLAYKNCLTQAYSKFLAHHLCLGARSQLVSANQHADQVVLLQKCSHCLKSLPAQAWYSCQACPLVRYCNPKCRESDVFHIPGGMECGLPWTLLLPADVMLAVRMANKIKQVVVRTIPG